MKKKSNSIKHIKQEIISILNAVEYFDEIYQEILGQEEPNKYIKEIIIVSIQQLNQTLENLVRELYRELEKQGGGY